MHLLILGANSDIAQAMARKFAREEHANLFLASRDMEVLQKRARDIATRCQVDAAPFLFDATDYPSHTEFYGRLDPKPDGVVLAFGYLGDQKDAEKDFKEARRIIDTNYTGAVSILEVIARDFERRGHGFIIGIGSAAGERGRQSNYIYGSAKGALMVYLSGLRHRLSGAGVHVITVIPGFVRSKMTDHLKMPRILVAEPSEVADAVYAAWRKKKDRVYTRWFWRWIMLIIKTIPEGLFKRTRL